MMVKPQKLRITQPLDKQKSVAPLGNNTNKSANRTSTGLKADYTLQNYQLLAVIRGLYLDEARKSGIPEFDYHKTSKCRHVRLAQNVSVKANSSASNLDGIVRCGRVWTCPVCSNAIQEQRRVEVGKAVTWAYSNGLKAVMVTFTHPHTRDNLFKLKQTLDAKAKVLSDLRTRREWKGLKNHSYEGFIRSLEVTIGKNGWHVHTHELIFVDRNADADQIMAPIKHRYRELCIKHGLLDGDDPKQLEAFKQHSVDVMDNADCSAYLAKCDAKSTWGADAEMTKSNKKIGKSQKTKSVYSLLSSRSKFNDRLWIQYTEAMHRQKQLQWSVGLKSKVGIDEVSDEAAAELETDSMDVIGTLTPKQWEYIAKHKEQPHLLNLINKEIARTEDTDKRIKRPPKARLITAINRFLKHRQLGRLRMIRLA